MGFGRLIGFAEACGHGEARSAGYGGDAVEEFERFKALGERTQSPRRRARPDVAIKKSDLYSSLWASCDELRGGMDASQYKDYVLFMLFIKYITDKYGNSNDFAPPVTIPKGASFKDMLALKRQERHRRQDQHAGHRSRSCDANARLARSDFPDFNDPNKLGEGQAKVERLTNLINIFAEARSSTSRRTAPSTTTSSATPTST